MSSVRSIDDVIRDLRTYGSVHLTLSGIVFLPTVVVWFVSFCVVRARGDPVRRLPFTWMKVAYPMFALAIFFTVAALSIAVAIYTLILDVDRSYSEEFMFAIEQASEHVWQLGLFFDWLTMIAVVLCIVELGLAFLRIWHGSKVSLHALARYGTLSFAAIIFTLSIAHFGRMQRLITLQYDAVRNRSVFQGNFSSDFYAMARLRTAIDCLIFVGSVALVGFTGMVFAMSLKTTAQPLKKPARIVLVIGILFLLRCTWKLAYDAAFLLPENVDFPNWPDVVEPILNDWVTFVILILIFVIGCRKRDGLWSLGHQWNNPQQPAVWAPQGPQTAWVPQGPQAAWLPPQGQQPAYGAPGAIPPEGYANAGYTQQPYAPKP